MPAEGRWLDVRPGAFESEVRRIKYDVKVRFFLAAHIGRAVVVGGVRVVVVRWGTVGERGDTGEVNI